MDRVVIVIPARYGSSRFPGKPLAKLGGSPIIQWTYSRALKIANVQDVVIATDDNRIYNEVLLFNGRVVMTSKEHPSGTDRIWEVVSEKDFDIVVNIQGDEPLFDINDINRLVEIMKKNPTIEMGTLAVRRKRIEIGQDPNIVKVVLDKNGMALYFSRSEIPFDRDRINSDTILQHIGIYAYRYDMLKNFVSLKRGFLEDIEKLEQLRALENGIGIYTLIVDDYFGIGIDTEEDLYRAEKFIKGRNIQL